MAADLISEFTKGGLLRAGINCANALLVSGVTPDRQPYGVAPDVAKALADKLSLRVSYVLFDSPGEVADAAATDAWDICLIAAEPERAKIITFSAAYAEIAATYLVPPDSEIQTIEDVDRSGVRIAVSGRSAYDLYLTRTLKHAQLHRAEGERAAFELFVSNGLDALAALRPSLQGFQGRLAGSRILSGHFTTVQQAIGTNPANAAAKQIVDEFLEEAKASGLIADLIKKHGVEDRLQVAARSAA